MNYYQYQTVLGLLTICEENDAVIAINVGHYSENKGEKRESELIRRTYKQFVEYLDGKRKVFDLPLSLKGTDFQKQVWQALPSGMQLPARGVAAFGVAIRLDSLLLSAVAQPPHPRSDTAARPWRKTSHSPRRIRRSIADATLSRLRFRHSPASRSS